MCNTQEVKSAEEMRTGILQYKKKEKKKTPQNKKLKGKTNQITESQNDLFKQFILLPVLNFNI